jgi:Holliday junction DNA helicase RuvA
VLSFIEGRVAKLPGEGKVVVRVGDFGLLCEMVPREANSLRTGEEVKLYTHLHLSGKDLKVSLFAFLEEVERMVFERLLRGPGVGPKVALALLEMGTARLLRAIEEEQVATLTGTPGVGARTAQRLVVELKGKFAEFISRLPEAEAPPTVFAEVTAALVGLGFRENEVLSALDRLHSDGKLSTETPIEEVLRIALERLRH